MIKYQGVCKVSILVALYAAVFSCNEGPDPGDRANIMFFTEVIRKDMYPPFKPSDAAITTHVLALEAEPYLSLRSDDDLYIHSFPHLEFHNHLQVVDMTTWSYAAAENFTTKTSLRDALRRARHQDPPA